MQYFLDLLEGRRCWRGKEILPQAVYNFFLFSADFSANLGAKKE